MSYTYDPAGNLLTRTGSNGAAVSYAYNKGNLAVSMQNTVGGVLKNNYSYEYSFSGQKTKERDLLTSLEKNYTYDGAGRLSTENYKLTANSPITEIEYSYDLRNNITSVTKTTNNETILEEYCYNLNNVMIAKDTKLNGYFTKSVYCIHDENGNVAEERTYLYSRNEDEDYARVYSTDVGTYEYNFQNKIIAFRDSNKELSYSYDVNGLRKSKTVGGVNTAFVWTGQNLACETKGADKTYYIYDMTGIILSENGANSKSYLKDSHGNVTSIYNGSQLENTYQYSAFGNEITGNAFEQNPFGYCGEYTDNETGLVYLRNRYYSAATGRFLTEDPIRSGLNWYVYCDNDPINRKDSNGESWEEYDSFLSKWVQNKILELTNMYYAAGDSRNERGGYVRDDIHNEAVALRLGFLDNIYVNYAVKDFETFGITTSNYLDSLGLLDKDITYYQALYTYAMELQNSSSTKHMVRNSDGSLSNEWLRAVSILGGVNGTPRNNQAQNRQARAAVKKYNLSKDGQRALHDEISKQGLGFDEIMEVAASIAERGGKYVR